MSVLRIRLQDGIVREHYQRGMQRMMEVPVTYGTNQLGVSGKEFFAYLSTLGGGLVGGDSYEQSFVVQNTKASINSQSSQKIYKGSSRLDTKITVDKDSTLVYHNDANIFYKKSDFISKSILFLDSQSKLFYLDGGFLGYAEADFSANMSFRLYLDYKLSINDVFFYKSRENLNLFFRHDYFYTVVMRGAPEFETIYNDNLKSYVSTIDGTTVVRVLADDNDIAMKYIESIKNKFLQQEDMKIISKNGDF